MHRAAKDLLALDSGMGDEWGWCMGHWFGVAETLYVSGESIPSAWAYRAGAGVDVESVEETWPDSEWFALLDAGSVTADDLRHVGNVLTRYALRLERAGLNY